MCGIACSLKLHSWYYRLKVTLVSKERLKILLLIRKTKQQNSNQDDLSKLLMDQLKENIDALSFQFGGIYSRVTR